MKYLFTLFLLPGCMALNPRQISTDEALWLEDPKSGDLLYCKTHVTFSDSPVCWLPKKVDGDK